MEYVKTLFGSQANANQPTGAETVERLVERVQTSILLEDRRDACRALKALSKKFRLEVGAQGMDALIKILETDRSDAEIVGYALDAISNVISGAQEEDIIPEKSDEDLGVQFTEIYIKKTENVTLLLELLDEFDFKVRWPAVKLLTGLLIHKARELQEVILVSPMGVSRLMDLLSDTREVIRNDALLLLAHLTKSNANIQKIVAFENAFDRLLDTIAEEGNSDGGVVVEDCILVMLNLLKNNTSNQNFFKEGSYIQRLTSFFDLRTEPTEEDKGWTSQKVTNIHLMLQVVRTLVSPNNPVQQLLSCQKTMNQCGLLQQLCSILMASGVSADILTENINTVAEVIRGNHNNQEYFASVTAPTNPPRPAIVVLLMSMVNEKQPFGLRCAVLYCFQCFLFKNELGQAQIIQTLLPTTADTVTTITAGQLLCGGLFSIDSLSNWFASVALSHALVDNPTQKEQLLRVQLATSVGNPPVSLMKQCATILQQGGKVQTRIGLLMLTSTWLAHSTLSVTHFLSMPTNIPFLTSQVALAEGDELELLVQGICAFVLGICIEYNDDSQPSFTKDDLCQLIVKRVGLDTFLDKLSVVSKHESYSRAAQNPYLKYKAPNDVLFDFEFCRLFKSLEGLIIKAVQPKPKDLTNGPESTMTPEQQKLLQQYKDVIRDQDQKLHDLKQQLEEITAEHKMATSQLQEMSSSIQQLRDQNSLLKAQRSAANNSNERTNSPNLELNQVKQELEELRQKYEKVQEELKEKNDSLSRINESKELENIQENQQESPESQKIIEQLNNEIKTLKQTIDRLEKELKVAESQNEETEKQLKTVREEHSKITTEQEDLLVLLTEQDTKILKYQQRLKELGDVIEDEDDDDVLNADDGYAKEDF